MIGLLTVPAVVATMPAPSTTTTTPAAAGDVRALLEAGDVLDVAHELGLTAFGCEGVVCVEGHLEFWPAPMSWRVVDSLSHQVVAVVRSREELRVCLEELALEMEVNCE